jgi:hypothetical protein
MPIQFGNLKQNRFLVRKYHPRIHLWSRKKQTNGVTIKLNSPFMNGGKINLENKIKIAK